MNTWVIARNTLGDALGKRANQKGRGKRFNESFDL